ncbi:hypothetical protein DFH28DRAFT_1124762 [Melampsora americana]|nr:hypothetical protein DFH28DRAFT_1124762 [Melampsora americana]
MLTPMDTPSELGNQYPSPVCSKRHPNTSHIKQISSMGVSGRAIACPLGPRSTKRKKTDETPALREKAEHDKAQREWGEKKCEEIIQALNPPPPIEPRDVQQAGDTEYDHDHDQDGRVEYFQSEESNDEQEAESDPENIHTYVQLVTGNNYRSRRIREHRQWKEIMQKTFIVFMKTSELTSEWGNDSIWNHDFNIEDDCSCGNRPGLKRTRTIDTVDIIYRRKIEVEFCSCTPDQVRLINQGYLGGSPANPETAFSLRLLRLYHLSWKYCHAKIQPFSLMIDELLDAHNPKILVPGTTEPRLWRKPLSAAVYCYRQILKMIEDLEARSLSLTPLELLASNCPRCFGPAGASGIQKGPQFVVCVDGNFQQRCHESASKNIEEIELLTPSLFMHSNDVARWEPNPLDARHPEVALRRLIDAMLRVGGDVRRLASAHFVHALIGLLFNAILEAHTDTNKAAVAILYDIGCTLEKGVIKNGLFQDERNANRLRFGTSAFHAYVHRWSCQLQYNPRLNVGWGLSDGEGLERNWSEISPLISALRWASPQTRLDAIHLKLRHGIALKLLNAAKSASNKLRIAEKRLNEARNTLISLQETSGLTTVYFAEQWERQRHCQLEVMADNSLQNLQLRLQRLIELEEDFRVAHDEYNKLRRKRRRTLSEEEHTTLRSLPSTLVLLEEDIADLVVELGGEEFRDMPEVKDPRARFMMRVRVAKEKLYEAKVGKVEWQKKWDQPGIGTSEQARYKEVMEKKNKALLNKYNTYKANVEAYHVEYPDLPNLQLPIFEEVKSLPITDPFWNIGHLTHPDEPWAIDLATQTGIQAFRGVRSCEEEVERISCEVQNMARSALLTEERLAGLLTMSQIPWIDGCPNGRRPLELPALIWNTACYSTESAESIELLMLKWKGLIDRSSALWEKIVNCPSVPAQPMDDLEMIEQGLLLNENDLADVNI